MANKGISKTYAWMTAGSEIHADFFDTIEKKKKTMRFIVESPPVKLIYDNGASRRLRWGVQVKSLDVDGGPAAFLPCTFFKKPTKQMGVI